jgi:hypothetical protein
MPALSSTSTTSSSAADPTVVSSDLRCALTGRPLSPEEAYWAPPLITARELIETTMRTLFSAPSNLGAVLTAEQPNVPFAPEARPQLANRRSVEQLKLLALLMLIAALLIAPIVLLMA